MGALKVELLHEAVEGGLLLQAVHARRPGGLFFEGQLHAFMTPVLLRVARLDALDLDSKPQPPDAEPAEVEQRVGGGEGRTIVRTDA